MFTGLVQAVGSVVAVRPREEGVRIEVDAAGLALDGMAVGDSIAVNGACLTVVALQGTCFAADVSRESLARTCGLDRPGPVNLEAALALGDRLGGHLVAGHVDDIGRVVRLVPDGGSVELVLSAPGSLAPYLAPKGSVAVNGVSLTVNRVQDAPAPASGCEFSINLIPHTLAATTLHTLRAGDPVNLEADLVARYVARMAAFASIPGRAAPPAAEIP